MSNCKSTLLRMCVLHVGVSEWEEFCACERGYRLALWGSLMRFFFVTDVLHLSLSLSVAWKPSGGCVPGRVFEAIYVGLCGCGPASVCWLQAERTDRLASGNMDCGVCGCAWWAESSENFRQRVWRCGLTSVCVCLQSTWGEGESTEGAALTPHCPPANTSGTVTTVK